MLILISNRSLRKFKSISFVLFIKWIFSELLFYFEKNSKLKFKKSVLLFYSQVSNTVDCDSDARRLLEDLLGNYDSIVRPVIDPNEQIKLSLGIKLSQIADIVRMII
jgi:hypothetical protein